MHKLKKWRVAVIFTVLATSCFAREIKPNEASLRDVAQKTIVALATSNADYLASIVDPQGIYLGIDSPKLSARTFRSDLQNHRGVYCDLLEKGCNGKSLDGGSPIGHVLHTSSRRDDDPLKNPLKVEIHNNEGIAYVVGANNGEGLFTLHYRFGNGKWYLFHIEYV